MIKKLDATKMDVAKKVLAVQIPSYRAEADKIDYDIPSLKEAAESIQGCHETFYGYFKGGELAGVISYKVKDHILDIHRLIVHPRFFRQGVARNLLNYIEDIESNVSSITVSTGAKNVPALTLYKNERFVETRTLEIGHGLRLTSLKKDLNDNKPL